VHFITLTKSYPPIMSHQVWTSETLHMPSTPIHRSPESNPPPVSIKCPQLPIPPLMSNPGHQLKNRMQNSKNSQKPTINCANNLWKSTKNCLNSCKRRKCPLSCQLMGKSPKIKINQPIKAIPTQNQSSPLQQTSTRS
jgi:hypothetical protein